MKKLIRARIEKIGELRPGDFVVFQWRNDLHFFYLCFVQSVEKQQHATIYTLFDLEDDSWAPLMKLDDREKVTYNLYTPSLEEMRTLKQFSLCLPLITSNLGENIQLAEQYVRRAGQIFRSYISQYPDEKPSDICQRAESFTEELFITPDVLLAFVTLALRAGENPDKVLSVFCDAFVLEEKKVKDLAETHLRQIQMNKNKAMIQDTMKKLEQVIGVIEIINPLCQKLQRELNAMKSLIPTKLDTETPRSEPAAQK